MIFRRPCRRVGAVLAIVLGVAACTGSDGGTSNEATTSAFIPLVGTTWTYQRDTGGETSERTLHLTAVHTVSDGTELLMRVVEDGQPKTLAYLVRPDGSEEVPIADSLRLPPGTTARVSSGAVVIPSRATLAAGTQITGQAEIELSQGGQSSTFTIDETVRGAGMETVTVPAGTYTAQVAKLTLVEHFASRTATVRITYWLASDFGAVQVVEVASSETTAPVRIVDRLTLLAHDGTDSVVFVCNPEGSAVPQPTRCVGTTADASQQVVRQRLEADARVAGFQYDPGGGKFTVQLHDSKQSGNFLSDYLFGRGVAFAIDCNEFPTRPPACGAR